MASASEKTRVRKGFYRGSGPEGLHVIEPVHHDTDLMSKREVLASPVRFCPGKNLDGKVLGSESFKPHRPKPGVRIIYTLDPKCTTYDKALRWALAS